MSYLLMGGRGGRIRVRASLMDQRVQVMARELAMLSGAAVLLEVRPAWPYNLGNGNMGQVVAQYVRKGNMVVRVSLNIGKVVRL